MNFNDHDIHDEQVISRDETNVVLEFVIPASSDFFDDTFLSTSCFLQLLSLK